MPRRKTFCKMCGCVIYPKGYNPGIYCSLKCKGDWQRTQKPVTEEWLCQKYLVECLNVYDIAKLVKRNPRRVWEWLKDCGIPTRPRGTGHDANPAFSFWLHGNPSPFQGWHHTEETKRKASERCKAEGRIPFDPKVGPPFKGKRGAEIPSWKGGVTPERAAFYASLEWKAVARRVWIRDKATCQRCGRRRAKGDKFAFDIHHIVSFAYKPFRAKLSNLILLCETCHYWAHSNANTEKLFIQEITCHC